MHTYVVEFWCEPITISDYTVRARSDAEARRDAYLRHGANLVVVYRSSKVV